MNRKQIFSFIYKYTMYMISIVCTSYLLYKDIYLFTSKPTFTSDSEQMLKPNNFPNILLCPLFSCNSESSFFQEVDFLWVLMAYEPLERNWKIASIDSCNYLQILHQEPLQHSHNNHKNSRKKEVTRYLIQGKLSKRKCEI